MSARLPKPVRVTNGTPGTLRSGAVRFTENGTPQPAADVNLPPVGPFQPGASTSLGDPAGPPTNRFEIDLTLEMLNQPDPIMLLTAILSGGHLDPEVDIEEVLISVNGGGTRAMAAVSVRYTTQEILNYSADFHLITRIPP